jgi:hypothetical protein
MKDDIVVARKIAGTRAALADAKRAHGAGRCTAGEQAEQRYRGQ